MSLGPPPDMGGNVTASAPCVSCSGQASGSNAARDQDYGGGYVPPGTPSFPCPADTSCRPKNKGG